MKRVVVIGGGFAGATVAKNLEDKFEVILIDTKEYFEYTPSILRTIIEPEHRKKIQKMHSDYLKKARIIVSDVKDVEKERVVLKGEKIGFDYLVICSGSRYNLPIKEQRVILPLRAEHLLAAHTNLEKAENVLIVGGGLVGVELAAEISCHYKEKKITLIHSHPRLMERNLPKAQEYVERFLRKKGVEIVFNEKVEIKGNKFFIKKGEITEDIVFLCTGIIPNFEFLKKHFKNVLNERHFLKVNEQLQLIGHNNIFVAGDVNDTAVEKTAQNATKQAMVVVSNIEALEKEMPLKPYPRIKTPIVTSLGKWNGTLEWNGFVVKGIIPGLMKSAIEKDVMWRRL
ncbi:MAG: FAD-dependent oxidoreductase [Candidatus Nanoarchaeia archaeon]